MPPEALEIQIGYEVNKAIYLIKGAGIVILFHWLHATSSCVCRFLTHLSYNLSASAWTVSCRHIPMPVATGRRLAIALIREMDWKRSLFNKHH